ncbi:DoxX family membrane protein [Lipingzhangella sp. LS1_29]|uniref:DoxX family membrane protein n=1 Tax=Lipingzhangella rawalii TaxID=2055835 RepID=A0ABU2H7H9_9ACTN|nr:DoxX family membrane protein [Lipingzhangella rawalii]MDS1271271.1 DoxX family membrane protein [Lipingzhangella rawalii]
MAALVARCGVGGVLLARGAQRLSAPAPTEQALAMAGLPTPRYVAEGSALVELVCGAALAVGVATPLAAILVSISFLAALWLSETQTVAGTVLPGYDPPLLLILALTCLLVAAAPGRLTLDRLGRSRWDRRSTTWPQARPGPAKRPDQAPPLHYAGDEAEPRPHRGSPDTPPGPFRP